MRLAGLAALVLAALMTLAACSLVAPQPEKDRFVVLTAAAPAAPVPSKPGGTAPGPLALGLGPVQLPQYLDRPELVIRTSPNGLQLSNRDRWAEPLGDNFRHVLASDLMDRLGTDDLVQYPWYEGTKLDYVVRVQVQQFDARLDGMAELAASWQLVAPKTGAMLTGRHSEFSKPADPHNGDQVAAALSGDVADLSSQIAEAIAQAEQQHFARRQN